MWLAELLSAVWCINFSWMTLDRRLKQVSQFLTQFCMSTRHIWQFITFFFCKKLCNLLPKVFFCAIALYPKACDSSNIRGAVWNIFSGCGYNYVLASGLKGHHRSIHVCDVALTQNETRTCCMWVVPGSFNWMTLVVLWTFNFLVGVQNISCRMLAYSCKIMYIVQNTFYCHNRIFHLVEFTRWMY